MKRLMLIAALLLGICGQAFGSCDVTIDGHSVCDFDVTDWSGIDEPATSPLNFGRLYYDRTQQDWYCSKDGGAFALCFTGGGGAGSGGTVTLQYGDITVMSSTFTLDIDPAYYEDDESPTNEWNLRPRDLWLLNSGDTMFGTLHFGVGANITLEAGNTVDGRDVSIDGSKLDGIESGADVTDAANVAAAGAVMDGDFSSNGLMTRTSAGGYTSRTLTGDAEIVVSNGDGVSGNPTLSIASSIARDSELAAQDECSEITGCVENALTTVDISDDTNLTAGTGINLNGDTISVQDIYVLTAGDTMIGNLNVDAQMVIGSQAAPEASIILDLSASDQALRVTRLADPTANIATPRHGMIAYDSTDDQLQAYIDGTWVDIGGSGGSTDWDNIGDPSASATIAFGGTQQTISSSLDDPTAGLEASLTITNTDADLSNQSTLLRLRHADDSEFNAIWLQMQDNGGDNVIQFYTPAQGSIPGVLYMFFKDSTLTGQLPAIVVAYEDDGDDNAVAYEFLDNSVTDIMTKNWGDGFLFTKHYVLGSSTLSSGTCADATSDRWYGDKDCSGTKDSGESFFDIASPGGFGFTIDNDGSAITNTGTIGVGQIAPEDCTISSATVLADVSGSINVAVYKQTYANYPAMTEISASADMNLTTAIKSQDTTLTGWTTNVTAGDVLEFYITATPTTVTAVSGFVQCDP